MNATKSYRQMILQAKRSPVLIRANTRRNRPAVAVLKSFDHDVAGRVVKETHSNIGANIYTLETQYWPDGSLRKKKLADGTWTGEYKYDLAGRLATFDNANAASASEPDLFIQGAEYKRTRTNHVDHLWRWLA